MPAVYLSRLQIQVLIDLVNKFKKNFSAQGMLAFSDLILVKLAEGKRRKRIART